EILGHVPNRQGEGNMRRGQDTGRGENVAAAFDRASVLAFAHIADDSAAEIDEAIIASTQRGANGNGKAVTDRGSQVRLAGAEKRVSRASQVLARPDIDEIAEQPDEDAAGLREDEGRLASQHPFPEALVRARRVDWIDKRGQLRFEAGDREDR